MKNKKLQKRLLIIIGLSIIIIISSLIVAYKLFLDPYRGTVTTTVTSKDLYSTLTKAEALDDLNYIVEQLTDRHPACMEGLPDKVVAQLEMETEQMSEEVTVLQLWQTAARILAKMGDAHTGIRYNGIGRSSLPIRFEMTGDRLICVTEGYEGAEVVSINETPIKLLHSRFLNQFSYELENYGTYQFALILPYKEYLSFVGIDTSSDINVTFRTKDKEWEETLTFAEPVQDTDTSEEAFVSYDIDKENSLGILSLKACNNNDIYKTTLNKFFMEVKQNNIEHVAVDLRYNGGGNSSVINDFLRYLDIDKYSVAGGMDVRYGPILYLFDKQVQKNKKAPDLLFRGKVYALTSTNSFSSANMFANTIQDNGIGQVIGEIPGNMPSSYGDILTFQTPNSKLIFHVSYKYFRRIDETKSDLPLLPDFEVKAEEAPAKLREIIRQ